MTASAPPDSARPALMPAGRRWGCGADSVAPYLRDVWSGRTQNPVFTPGDFASVVWPAKRTRSVPPSRA
jgi:hypothetical protein